MIRLPGQTRHPLGVALHWRPCLLACFGVPQSDSIVHTTCCYLALVRRPRNGQHPACMTSECVHGSSSIAIPYPSSIITTSTDHPRRRSWRKLCSKNGLSMPRYRRRTSRHGLNFENCLWCCRYVLHLLGTDESGLQQGLVDVNWKCRRYWLIAFFVWHRECEAVRYMV